jgi:hypothetical protein
VSGDQLPVAGSAGGNVVPASVSGDLTTHQGEHGSLARTEPGQAAVASANGQPPSVQSSPALGSALDGLANELHLSDQQLQTYRTWFAQNREHLEDSLQSWADERQIAVDAMHRAECEAVLHMEWGASYEANIERIKGWLSTLPHHLAQAIREGRYYGGQLVCNDPNVARALLQASTSSPGRSAADVDRRIAQIHLLMRDMSSEYWKGPRASAIQAEYRELVNLQQQRRS